MIEQMIRSNLFKIFFKSFIELHSDNPDALKALLNSFQKIIFKFLRQS